MDDRLSVYSGGF